MTKHTRANPELATNAIILIALVGAVVVAGALFTFRNTAKIKGFISEVTDINTKLTEIMPKLQSNMSQLTKMTDTAKGYIPKEASAIAKLLQR